MLSQDEFNVMKEQLIQLHSENDEMTQKIDILKESNKQITLIQQNLKSTKEEIERLQEDYEKKIESLNAQLEEYADGKIPSKIMTTLYSTISIFNQEDHQYASAKTKLDSECDHLVELAKDEATIFESIENLTNIEQSLSHTEQEYNDFFNKFNVLRPQIETCLGVGLYVQDLATRLDNIKKSRSVQAGRRFRLRNWQSKVKADYEAHHQLMEGHEKDHQKIQKKQEELDKILHETEISLRNEATKINQQEIAFMETQNETERYIKETGEIIEKLEKEIETIKTKTFPELENQIKSIQGEINNFDLKKKKLLQKKIEMIQQLEKRIKQERKDQEKKNIKSPLVLQLTEVEETHLLEKEEMERHIKSLEDRKNWLEAEVEKKGQIISEIDNAQMPMDEPVDEETCLQMFYTFVDEIKITNRALLNDLHMFEDELEGAQGENQSLKAIIAELDRSANNSRECLIEPKQKS